MHCALFQFSQANWSIAIAIFELSKARESRATVQIDCNCELECSAFLCMLVIAMSSRAPRVRRQIDGLAGERRLSEEEERRARDVINN